MVLRDGELAIFGVGLSMLWDFPLNVAGLNADQAQGLYQALNRATTTTPRLTALAPSGCSNSSSGAPEARSLKAGRSSGASGKG